MTAATLDRWTISAASSIVTSPIVTSPVVSSPVGAPSRLRLTARGRAVLAGIVVLPLAIGIAVFSWGSGSAIATDVTSTAGFEYVQVESGQSLWQVAAAIAPQADPRDVVSDIIHLNGLQSSDVQPGQRLAVPQAYAD